MNDNFDLSKKTQETIGQAVPYNDAFSDYREKERLQVNKAAGFLDKYTDYYDYKLSDEDIIDDVTQSFYQSMYLSRKRLRENGLTLHYDIHSKKETKKEIIDFGTEDETSTYATPMKTKKEIWKNGKVIKKSKGNTIALADVTRPCKDEDEVQCPKCGNVGKLSSYIDGCDYCGSKFMVSSFREKIASFKITEDIKRMSTSIFKKFFIFLGISIPVLVFIFIISIIAAIILGDSKYAYVVNISMMVSYKVIPIFILTIVVIGIIFTLVWSKFLLAIYKRIEKSEIVNEIKRYYPKFSDEKFTQDLEYKLKNIHFAQNANEVNVFFNTDDTPIIENYKNIIECDLQKIKFLGFVLNQDGCNIRVRTKLRLTIIEGNKTKEKTESVILIVSYKNEALARQNSDIEIYTCHSCGSTVNLLNGGVCEHCGSRIDYTKYSFKIEVYYSNHKKYIQNVNIKFGKEKQIGLKTKIKLALTTFILSAGLITGISLNMSCGKFIEMFFKIDEIIASMETDYDEIKTLGEMYSEIKLQSKDIGAMRREYTYRYSVEDKELLDNYMDYLVDNGFKKISNQDKNIIVYEKTSKISEMLDVPLYFQIIMEVKGDKLIINYLIEDYDELSI